MTPRRSSDVWYYTDLEHVHVVSVAKDYLHVRTLGENTN